MSKKVLAACLMLAALSVPSLAATPMFYVAQDAKTHKCAVSNAKPDGKAMMDVGTKAYDSKSNAEKAMANLGACKG